MIVVTTPAVEGRTVQEYLGVAAVIQELEDQADKLGADGVLGVDIDDESVGNAMLMVSASGTAVRLS